jgi:hypothetical protein
METKKYYRLNDASNGSLVVLINNGQLTVGETPELEIFKPGLISYNRAQQIGRTVLVLALFSGLFFFGLSA